MNALASGVCTVDSTCAVQADESVAAAWVQLQAGVAQELLAMEGERETADVHVCAVGVRRQDPSHSSGLHLFQLKLVQLLSEERHVCWEREAHTGV